MKRSEIIVELVKLYDSFPREASSYHKIDMLLRKAKRLGVISINMPDFEELEESYEEDKSSN